MVVYLRVAAILATAMMATFLRMELDVRQGVIITLMVISAILTIFIDPQERLKLKEMIALYF